MTNIGSSGSQYQPSRPKRVSCARDDVGQVQRAGAQQHGDDDEADRDFVGHHLRRRAQRRQERIFRVRRPAGHDDAVDAERRDGEEIEDADVDVGDRPAVGDRDHRPGGERQHRPMTSGARRNTPLLAPAGMIGSLRMNLRKSAKGCSTPQGPTTFGPRRSCTARPDLALGVDQHRGREQDADQQQQALEHVAHEDAERRAYIQRRSGSAADEEPERARPRRRRPRAAMTRPVRRAGREGVALLIVVLFRRLPRLALRQGRAFGHDAGGARDRVGEIEVGDGRGERRVLERAADGRRARSNDGRVGRRDRVDLDEMRDGRRTSAARSAASESKGSCAPSASDSARRIAQSSRASPGGKTARSANCGAALGVDVDARLLGIGGAGQDDVGAMRAAVAVRADDRRRRRRARCRSRRRRD